MEKALSEQGKVSKGCRSGEDKMSYAQAQKDFKKLETYFLFHGMMSMGICGDCDNFSIRGHQNRFGEFGSCKGNKTVHYFDSCDQNSTRR